MGKMDKNRVTNGENDLKFWGFAGAKRTYGEVEHFLRAQLQLCGKRLKLWRFEVINDAFAGAKTPTF